ncbi:MAG: ion transporter [Bradymonadaceae bacterium]
MGRARQFTYDLLESDTPSKSAAQLVRGALVALIALNVGAVIIATMPSMAWLQPVFRSIEVVSVAVFTIEYFARVWCIGEELEQPILGRIRFALRPMMLIDLVALVPSYLPMALDLRFARAFRLIRLLKLTRHSESLQIVVNVLSSKREELASSGFIAFILLLVSSSAMYYAEHSVQPKAFSSIPATMWWGVETLTTVGYGDVVPQTALGKFIGMIVAIIGIGLFALPAGILASGFSEEVEKRID